ncbi:MAG: alpha/beta hydrolase [Bacteroidales bacterium]|jgi:pimeloyl-ACP methyl ester carboxylesterase|nr:alpha/beta hydrolase [Bacteroidales bacterium]
MDYIDKQIILGNRIIRYSTLGELHDKSIILFIGHLAHNSKIVWNPMATKLMSEGYSCIMTNLDGCDYISMIGADISIELLAKDILEIIKAENIPHIDIVCWCGGIKIALELYEHKKVSVRSIFGITIDYNESSGPFIDLIKMAEQVLDEKPHMESAIIAIIRKKTLHALGGANDIEELFLKLYDVDSAPKLRQFLLLSRLFRTRDKSLIMRKINIPVRLLYGSNDIMTPLLQQDIDIFNSNNNISYNVIDGASHYLPIEYPERVSNEIWNHFSLLYHKSTKEKLS